MSNTIDTFVKKHTPKALRTAILMGAVGTASLLSGCQSNFYKGEIYSPYETTQANQDTSDAWGHLENASWHNLRRGRFEGKNTYFTSSNIPVPVDRVQDLNLYVELKADNQPKVRHEGQYIRPIRPLRSNLDNKTYLAHVHANVNEASNVYVTKDAAEELRLNFVKLRENKVRSLVPNYDKLDPRLRAVLFEVEAMSGGRLQDFSKGLELANVGRAADAAKHLMIEESTFNYVFPTTPIDYNKAYNARRFDNLTNLGNEAFRRNDSLTIVNEGAPLTKEQLDLTIKASGNKRPNSYGVER